MEIAGTTSMKLSQGFTRLSPSILMFVFYGICFTFMTFCLTRIEVGIAYAVWSGLGTALVAIIGIIWFHESVSAIKLVSLVLIILGVVGLKLAN